MEGHAVLLEGSAKRKAAKNETQHTMAEVLTCTTQPSLFTQVQSEPDELLRPLKRGKKVAQHSPYSGSSTMGTANYQNLLSGNHPQANHKVIQQQLICEEDSTSQSNASSTDLQEATLQIHQDANSGIGIANKVSLKDNNILMQRVQ